LLTKNIILIFTQINFKEDSLKLACVEYASESIHILLQHVKQSLHESNQVHGDSDGVGKGEHQANGASKFGSCKVIKCMGDEKDLLIFEPTY